MIEIQIQKRLKGFVLDVSLSLGDELVAIFGPSGSGKSVTLQCIAGLLKPDSGRIVLNGRPVLDTSLGVNLPPQRRGIGYLFQDYALFPHLTVAENVAYGLHHLPKGERLGQVEKMLAAMRLDGLERRRPGELSGGQQQRVALARALVRNPELLLLDEPFSALDSPIRSRLHGELLRSLKRLAITTVLVTHDLAEAYTLSEKMVVFDAGRVLQVGPKEEVLRRPTSRRVARFTGTKNLFRGTVTHEEADHLELLVGSIAVRTPAGPFRVNEVVDLCLRPEEIELIRPEEEAGAAAEENLCRGEIVYQIDHGTSFTLLFRLTEGFLRAGEGYDLQIEVPAGLYWRLRVDARREWTVSLKRHAIHLIGKAAGRDVPADQSTTKRSQ